MSRIGKIARRTFLIGSVAVAGGVAFGVYQVKKPADNPLSSTDGETVLNPFVIINADGVTLIAPKAEMGQGVHTTWAALLAEELDVAWSDITVLHGPPAKAYYNSALFGLGLPFLDYEVGDFRQGLRDQVGEIAKLVGLQLTAGSTSMKDGFVRMREAGATARETLKLAAAARLGLSSDDLTTDNGMVIAPDGTRIPYADLAEDAAAIDPPRVALRDPSDWKYLGKDMPRVDMVGKVTGTAKFGIDTRLDGMRFATVRMTPNGGGMVRYDDSAARSMAGVEDVIDLGDGIAVVARNTWLAFRAAEAVEITWGPSPRPATNEALFDAITAAFDSSAPNATPRDEGDVDSVTEGTEITAEYRIPWLAHSTMEPMNATAWFSSGTMHIWAGNQSPTLTRDKVADAIGLTPDQVQVETPLMGGAFGRRGETDFSVLAARVALALPDTPVNVTWSREEDMRHDYYRPAAVARFRGRVQDGQAVMLDGKIAGHSVVKATAAKIAGDETPGPDREHVSGGFDQPYGIPNFRYSGYLAPTDIPVGYWRSVGASMNGFFFDTFIDEMAHAAARDPLQFRLELIRREHEPSAKVLEKVAEMSGWTGQTPAGTGRGVAFCYSYGTPVAQVCEVVEEEGRIRIANLWIACDVGTALDPRNIEAQMTGGALFGLSAAMMGEITFTDGAADQYNFPDYDALRIHTAPKMSVAILENNRHIGGVGEPATPPAPAALGNAIFDLSGERLRETPFNKAVAFYGV
jgi:isoquinoline 1-oxidoreductase beta subunit